MPEKSKTPLRIVLIHPYAPSMGPILNEFASRWPEAPVLSLLDECLYADVTPDGQMTADMQDRIRSLLNHAVASRADAVVFTGSTFGPMVDAARVGIGIPVLKADEAMVERALAGTGPNLLVCTAARAVPVIRANFASAANGRIARLEVLCVREAKAALEAGDTDAHDLLIAEAIKKNQPEGTVLLGQVSMGGVRDHLPPEIAQNTLFSASCTVDKLKSHFGR